MKQKGGVCNDVTVYLERMRPVTERIATQRATNHPYLGREDLVQEGMMELCRVWRRHRYLPEDDLYRVGLTAVLRRTIDQQQRSWSYGEGTSVWVDLDQPLALSDDGSVLTIADTLDADGVEDSFFAFGLQELERTLSDSGRVVLGEILEPGKKTLRSVRRMWASRGYRGWPAVRLCAFSDSLKLPVKDVRNALSEIRSTVLRIFGVHPDNGRYRVVGGVMQHQKEEITMAQKQMVPDPVALAQGLPTVKPKETNGKKASGGAKAKTKKGVAAAKPKAAAKTKTSGKYPSSKALILELFQKGTTVEKAASQVAKEFPASKDQAEPRTRHILRWAATKEGGFSMKESDGGVVKLTKKR